MTNKTRKHMWPVSLVVSVAIIGALAAFLVLANNPGATMAQSGGDDPCAGMTEEERAAHLVEGGECGEPVAAGAPMAPTGLTPSDITSDSITLTWAQTDPAADTFEVEVLDSAGAQVSTMAGVTGNSYMITGLSPITTYTLRVRGMNSAGDGAWAESTATTRELSPEERYDISILDDASVPTEYMVDPDDVATIYTTTYSKRVDDVTFEVSARDDMGNPLGASDEDVTLTVEVTPNAQAEVVDSLGLDSSGLNIGETLQGLITIRGVDEGRRNFSLDVVCLADGGQIDVAILDDQLNLVAEAMILCKTPVDAPAPTEQVLGCYAISGVPDRLGDMSGTAGIEYADVELYTSDESVQLTVSSYERAYTITRMGNAAPVITSAPCPDWPQPAVYLRLVDDPGTGEPIVDDEGNFVDDNGFLEDHGEVVGTDSHGKLLLNIESSLTGPDGASVGVRRGAFRVFTPDDVVVGDEYFVEVYDDMAKERVDSLHRDAYCHYRPAGMNYCPEHSYDYLTTHEQEYERVVYVDPPSVLPTELAVTTYSDVRGRARLSWFPGRGADKHHAIVIYNGMAVPNSYRMLDTTPGLTMSYNVEGLEEGKKYLFAVVAEHTDANGDPDYSDPAFIEQEMDWEE